MGVATPWTDIREDGNFGTPRDGAQDWTKIIQAAVDKLIAKNIQVDASAVVSGTLYFPPGIYKINEPIVIGVRGPKGYEACAVDLVGCSAGAGRSQNRNHHASIIRPTFDDRPAFILQGCTGVSISKLTIEGQNTWIDNADPTAMTTHLGSPDVYKKGTARDSQYSPYVAISIDPFSVDILDPYPNMGSYYPVRPIDPMEPVKEGRASSLIEIRDCHISGFVVGVMIGGSHIKNAENITLTDCSIVSTKSAVAIGHDQARHIVIKNLHVYGAECAIDAIHYGDQSGNAPSIFGANIKGVRSVLCATTPGGGYGINAVRAERILRVGDLVGGATRDGYAFNGCTFEFGEAPAGGPSALNHFFNDTSASFNGCTFRLATTAATGPEPMKFENENEGSLVLQSCTIEVRSATVFGEDEKNGAQSSLFWVSGNNERVRYRDCLLRFIEGNDVKVLHDLSEHRHLLTEGDGAYLRKMAVPGTFLHLADPSVTPDGPRWISGPLPRIPLTGTLTETRPGQGRLDLMQSDPAILQRIKVGDLLCNLTFLQALGRITAIANDGSSVTLTNLPSPLPPVQATFWVVYWPLVHPKTTGRSTSAAPDQITDVTIPAGIAMTDAWRRGDRIQAEASNGARFSHINLGIYIKEILVTNNGSLNFVLSGPANFNNDGDEEAPIRLFDADVHAFDVRSL